ncbi:MAG: helix-turn-helix domain-containing protein [Cytophagales bacterium]|nr:helix-turn-helix domain-containing protein [Armatimonadota bacterium]
MRSLDQFYRYIENQDAADTNGSLTRKAAKPPRGVAVRPATRYVIRNGVTVQIPVGDAGPGSEPEKTPDPDAPSAEMSPLIPEQTSPMPTAGDQDATDAMNWRSLPEPVQRLALLSADLLPSAVPQDGERRQLIERLLNPLLTLEDTARLLGVCTATVRRYANKGTLLPHRTVGQQRRFLLADVLALVETRKDASETIGATRNGSVSVEVS